MVIGPPASVPLIEHLLRQDAARLEQDIAALTQAGFVAQEGDGYFDWTKRPGNFAGIAVDDQGFERLGRVDLTGGSSESMPPAAEVGPTLDYTGDGAIAYSMDSTTQSFYLLWNTDSSIRALHVGAGKGFLLPRD